MVIVRKFYDIGTAEATGEAAIAEQQEQPSIAALMAKQGYRDSEDRLVEKPVENKKDNEQKVETKVEVPAAIASAETKVETVVQETKQPEVVETKVEEKQPTTISWQEVLKQQQPDTVLKELLGVDDKKLGFLKGLKDVPPQVVNIIDTWKSNGDLNAILKEMATDYSKMSSEDVMRHQLRLEYPKASEKAIEALFKKEVIDAYQLNPDKYSDDEVEEGQLLLDAKAEKFRDSLVQRQQEFLIPKAPEAVIQPDNSEQEEAAKFEERKAYVSNDPFVKNMFATKQFTVGEGTEAFNFPIDKEAVEGILFNGEKWAEAINDVKVDSKGQKTFTPKAQHQALVSMVAQYGTTFLDAYAQHFKTIGAKKVIDPLENAKPVVETNAATSEIAPTSAAAAMARTGRLTN